MTTSKAPSDRRCVECNTFPCRNCGKGWKCDCWKHENQVCDICQAIKRPLSLSSLHTSMTKEPSASEAEDAARQILQAMEDQFTEVTERKVTHSLQIQFNMGYGAAMSDLRHVLGDMFPSMKQ